MVTPASGLKQRVVLHVLLVFSLSQTEIIEKSIIKTTDFIRLVTIFFMDAPAHGLEKRWLPYISFQPIADEFPRRKYWKNNGLRRFRIDLFFMMAWLTRICIWIGKTVVLLHFLLTYRRREHWTITGAVANGRACILIHGYPMDSSLFYYTTDFITWPTKILQIDVGPMDLCRRILLL